MKYSLDENPARAIESMFADLRNREEKQRKVWQRCFEYTNNWRDGELGQWSSENRKAVGTDKPTLSFNFIRTLVNKVCGTQRGMKMDEKCYPRDDESDWMIAEILTDLLKHVRDENDAEILYAKNFRDAYICSRGFLKIEWGNERDPFGSVIYRYLDPFNVYVIGQGHRLDLTDRKGVLEIIPMDMEDIEARWPDKAEELKGLKADVASGSFATGDDYALPTEMNWDDVYSKDDEKFLVKRFQCYKWVDVKFIRSEGKMIETDLKKKELKAVVEIAKTQGIDTEVVSIKQRRVKTYTCVGDIALAEEWSSYEHGRFDIVPMIAYNDGGMWTGVVQDLLDPQDEKNKRHSQAMHILNTSAKNSYFYKEGALADPDAAKKLIGQAGSMIPVQGDINNVMKPVQSDLSAIPALMNFEAVSTNDMKGISGISDAALGITPEGVRSGRGIQALQSPSETIIAELLDNFIEFRKQVAFLTISLIQQFYTEEKRVRILGEYQAKYMPENEMIAQQVQMGMISFEDGMKTIIINKEVLGKKLNDVSVGKYDVVLDMVAQSPTMRRAQFFEMINLKAQGAPVKWSTVMKNSDMRGKMDAIRDIQEAEAMLAGGGMLPQMAPGQPGATPAIEQDLLGNTAGAQLP